MLALPSELVIVTLVVAVVMTFQLASTAFTVMPLAIAVPAVCAVGVPVLPEAVPGAAVSPGTNNCNFTKTPAFTVIDELVLAVLVPSVLSVAVTVRLPADFTVTLKVFVPATKAAFPGSTALLSEDVIATASVAFVIRFQLASTAFTVPLKAVPAVWAVGEPVLPVAVPGADVSPGARICNLLNAPTLSGIDALVLAVIPPCVESEAVTVAVPAVLSVTLKL